LVASAFPAVIVSVLVGARYGGWKETLEVLPAILVVAVSFGLTQFLWSNYVDSNLVDIVAGVVSIVVTLGFSALEASQVCASTTTKLPVPQRLPSQKIKDHSEANGLQTNSMDVSPRTYSPRQS